MTYHLLFIDISNTTASDDYIQHLVVSLGECKKSAKVGVEIH
jgi:hypothetical protein